MLDYFIIDPLLNILIIVIQRNRHINLSTLIILITFFFMGTKTASAATDEGAFGLINFAFASYLGTGFYTTTGQNVFVLQMPFDYTIKHKTDTDPGWVLKLPVTVGFINFDEVDFENLPDLKGDAATITFLPGLEYQYPVTPNWYLAPFADYGFARDLSHTNNILITGIGIKSYADFHLKNGLFTLGNRFLHARERSGNTSNDSSYTLFETGLNYRITSDYSFSNGELYTNLYYINFYYPNELTFLSQTENPIRVGVKNEVGITISNISDFLFFKKPQIGIGVRFGKEVDVYRIVFGAPF